LKNLKRYSWMLNILVIYGKGSLYTMVSFQQCRNQASRNSSYQQFSYKSFHFVLDSSLKERIKNQRNQSAHDLNISLLN
jgi:hypothetical protein